MVPVNYWAVLVSAVASMIIGSLWYGPIFGRIWMRLSKITPEQIAQAKSRSMAGLYVMAFVGSLVMAYVLDHSLIFAGSYFKTGGASAGLMAAFWSWLGFVAPVTLGSVLWEGKPWKLWFLNNAYYLVVLAVMGAILGNWM